MHSLAQIQTSQMNREQFPVSVRLDVKMASFFLRAFIASPGKWCKHLCVLLKFNEKSFFFLFADTER